MLLTTVANDAARAQEANPFPAMAEAIFEQLTPEEARKARWSSEMGRMGVESLPIFANCFEPVAEVKLCGVEKIVPPAGEFGGRLAMAQWTARLLSFFFFAAAFFLGER